MSMLPNMFRDREEKSILYSELEDERLVNGDIFSKVTYMLIAHKLP